LKQVSFVFDLKVLEVLVMMVSELFGQVFKISPFLSENPIAIFLCGHFLFHGE